jgi:hypothetical protein
MGATLKPVASGTGYATLYLPEGTAEGVDVNYSDVVMATTSNFALEQSILANDQTKAIIHIALNKTGACTTVAGGTITVNAPAGAKVAYFAASALPTGTSMIDRPSYEPIAIVYDVDPAATLDLTWNVPGCTVAPVGTVHNGVALSGKVTTMATEPGDNTAALSFILQ